jgi:hypothetical protein
MTEKAKEGGSLDLKTFTKWLFEIDNQPAWRSKADREMDYVDGNQLDSEILRKQQAIGMPPALEPLIGPAIESVLGLEAKTRTDWRITSDNGKENDDVAAALNFKLNQSERKSGADRACSDAFKPQLCVGLGWVEVSRESDPFKFPQRCKAVHRNEIHWDFLSVEPDLSDARYLVRRRWTESEQAILKFPDHKDLIERSNGRWTDRFALSMDGGASTDLAQSWEDERGWSIEEQQWRDAETGRVCLYEVWYRRWEQVTIIKTPDGRIVEVDMDNQDHLEIIAAGLVKPEKATVARMYMSYWMGPHKLHDGKSPYKHTDFPYVPFWGKREDRTNVPYGNVRGMIYLQDNVNSLMSKLRWGMSAVRTTRTKGAVAYSDEIFRQQSARIDADIILDPQHMAQSGAVFKVERDFELNNQQFQMLNESRAGIARASGITDSFQGQKGSATSGLQESTQIEQATQSLADLMDNFRFARTKVGELLLSMIVEDMIGKPEQVLIRGGAVKDDRVVSLNEPTIDEDGTEYLSNDVSRTILKVAVNDVPSTSSFRSQQLAAMSEAFKSMPQEYQVIALPHLLALMDVPDKEEIIKAIKEASHQQTPEQVQQQIDQAVKDALQKAGTDLKMRELDLKYSPDRMMAEIQKLVSETVKNNVGSSFAAMQAGEKIALVPQIGPIADIVMQQSGWRQPTPGGDDPNFPQPQIAPPQPMLPQGDTSPLTPMNPESAFEGEQQGMDTLRAD